MHRDLVLACSNPFAEGHGFVTRSFGLVQLCPDRLDRWMIFRNDSDQFPKPLDRLLMFVRHLRRRIVVLLRLLLSFLDRLVGVAPALSPTPPLSQTHWSTW